LYRPQRRLNTADDEDQMTSAKRMKKFVRVLGKRMAYVESGGGERVFLFLHGKPDLVLSVARRDPPRGRRSAAPSRIAR
jgi:hypothetical protein